ncbi:hypothetical protein [Egbenema bharatensis]|uniref:hypothetical protein n=1 Tax=Egbenema bharatensis TaxID=3463334 RepID=UPI003A8405D7
MLIDSNLIIYATQPPYALIAATCLEHQLPLATANEKDFEWVDGLTIHNPMRQDGKDASGL